MLATLYEKFGLSFVCVAYTHYIFHLADAFIQRDLQINKYTHPIKCKNFIFYFYLHAIQWNYILIGDKRGKSN